MNPTPFLAPRLMLTDKSMQFIKIKLAWAIRVTIMENFPQGIHDSCLSGWGTRKGRIHPRSLTARPLKKDGFKTTFLLGFGNFSGANYVKLRGRVRVFTLQVVEPLTDIFPRTYETLWDKPTTEDAALFKKKTPPQQHLKRLAPVTMSKK